MVSGEVSVGHRASEKKHNPAGCEQLGVLHVPKDTYACKLQT